MERETIPGHLLNQSRTRGDAPAVSYREQGTWSTITWSQYASEVELVARALMALGLEPEERVSILGFNRPEWVMFHVAAMMAGGVPAGIYETSSREGVAYILSHSESKVVLVENGSQLEKVAAERKRLPNLDHIVLMKGETNDEAAVLEWEAFLKKGEDVQKSDLEARLNAINPDSLATLIYTSGTTGPPKGVMLSHRNLTWTAKTAINMFDITAEDSSLSYLPLSHIAEQMFTIHAPMIAGWRIYFAESQQTAAEHLREIQPTIFFAVPRVWEKIHAVVASNLSPLTGFKRVLVEWARGVASTVHGAKNEGQDISLKTGISYWLARKLVFSKLKFAMGLGRSRFCVSGAAPISAELLRFFASLDIPILEVYGQSEGSGPTSFNRSGRTRYGSVGPPFPGTEVKTTSDGEIALTGPNVFLGYFKHEAGTAETLIDGWLYSGDLGRFDEDGFLWITGRKKEIIVTSGGKNIAPAYIEGLLKESDHIEQAVVIGDRRKYLTALVAVHEESGEIEGLREAIEKDIEEVNSRLSRVENVRKFRILPRPLMQEKGELTPTLKMVRHVVEENWRELIEDMYRENG